MLYDFAASVNTCLLFRGYRSVSSPGAPGHSLCVSVNFLIVHERLCLRCAWAWNIDKKHTVNPLTPGREAVQPAERGQLGGGGWAHQDRAALLFNQSDRMRVDLQKRKKKKKREREKKNKCHSQDRIWPKKSLNFELGSTQEWGEKEEAKTKLLFTFAFI